MITLNKDKWEYAQSQVTFAGFQLSQDGYNIDTAITDAIAKFPTPANRTDLRAFFGLANQLAASTDTLASLLGPLRPLLSTKNEFVWSPSHDQAFQTARQSLTSAPTLFFLTPQSLHICAPMRVDEVWVSSSSNVTMTSRCSYRLARDSFQMQSPDMP